MRIASKVFVTTRKEQNKNTLALGHSEVDLNCLILILISSFSFPFAVFKFSLDLPQPLIEKGCEAGVAGTPLPMHLPVNLINCFVSSSNHATSHTSSSRGLSVVSRLLTSTNDLVSYGVRMATDEALKT